MSRLRFRRLQPRSFDPADVGAVDPRLIRRLARPVDRVCRLWYGLEVEGLDRLPPGPALVVGNHNSGSAFIEAIGFGARHALHTGGQEPPWAGLAHDAILALPGVGRLLHRIGAVTAGHDTAAEAFAQGRKVVVFPGGNREAYRPFKDRDRVQLGDRRGFVRLALRHRVPIVPVVFVGGHSGFVVLHDGKRLARAIRADRWLRSDTWPLWIGLPFGVFLGPGIHLPLPVKCITRVLDPIPTARWEGRQDAEAVEAVFREVEGAMQAAMDELSARRRRRPWPLRR